jgi:hypothetical protein
MADLQQTVRLSRLVPLVHFLLLASPEASGQDGSTAGTGTQSDGKTGQAIALLKEEIERHPLDKGLRLRLARAYLDDGNDFWALRTVTAAAEIHPEDCNLRLWQAFIQLRQGELESARNLLQPPCATWPPTEARRSLLLALAEQGAGNVDVAQAHLDRARVERFAFVEDREAIAQVQAQLRPDFLAPFSGRLDLAVGGTSNARAGSPVDPGTQGNARSLVAQAAGFVRFVSPGRAWARLSLEAEARALGYQADAGKDFSYLQLGGRPGVLFEALGKRALLGYRYEALLLAAGDLYQDGPLWFFEAHRGEWELELGPSVTVFGGVGRRGFREIGRTRTEIDGGIGGGFPLGARLHVMAALSGRYHDAKNDAYDLRGVSLLLSAEHRFPGRTIARAGVLASADSYPRSAGYFDAEKDRRDLALRISLSVFAPPFENHVKLGVTYEFAVRDSTAAPYAYSDHRLLAKLVWAFTADPWLPHPVTPVGHVPIDYRLEAAESTEQVQDLLRSSEAAQRSSSCRE